MPRLRVAAAQIDVVVGDLAGNVDRILEAYEAAEAAGCDLVVFPELTITGYPPEDLLLRPAFVAQAGEALDKLAARTGRCAAVVGFPQSGRDLHNAAAVCAHGRVHGVYRKQLLPNYAVFDEQRYFTPRHRSGPAVRRRRRQGRRLDLRGRVEPDRSDPRAGRRRRGGDRQPQRVALLRGPARRARDDARDTRAPTRRCRSSTPTSSAARTSSCSTARRSCSTSRAISSPAPASSTRTSSSSTSTCGRRSASGCSTRAAGRGRRRSPRSRSPRSGPPTAPSRRASSRRSAPTHEVYEALVLGTRDYVTQERVHRRARSRSRAASTRRSSPRSPSTRSAPSTSSAC